MPDIHAVLFHRPNDRRDRAQDGFLDDTIAVVVTDPYFPVSLADILAYGKPPEMVRVWLFRMIVDAVRLMHKKGIVHGRISAETVRVAATGHVQLVGFDHVVDAFRDSDLDKPTPMALDVEAIDTAPECFGSDKPADLKADLWALGVLLFQIVTDTHPFAGLETGRPTDVRSDLLQRRAVCLNGLADSPARGLIDLLMAVNPADRLGFGRPGQSSIQTHPFFATADDDDAYSWSLFQPVFSATYGYLGQTAAEHPSVKIPFWTPFSHWDAKITDLMKSCLDDLGMKNGPGVGNWSDAEIQEAIDRTFTGSAELVERGRLLRCVGANADRRQPAALELDVANSV